MVDRQVACGLPGRPRVAGGEQVGGPVEGAGGGGEGRHHRDQVPPDMPVHAVADLVGEDGFDLPIGEGFEQGVGHEEG